MKDGICPVSFQLEAPILLKGEEKVMTKKEKARILSVIENPQKVIDRQITRIIKSLNDEHGLNEDTKNCILLFAALLFDEQKALKLQSFIYEDRGRFFIYESDSEKIRRHLSA